MEMRRCFQNHRTKSLIYYASFALIPQGKPLIKILLHSVLNTHLLQATSHFTSFVLGNFSTIHRDTRFVAHRLREYQSTIVCIASLLEIIQRPFSLDKARWQISKKKLLHLELFSKITKKNLNCLFLSWYFQCILFRFFFSPIYIKNRKGLLLAVAWMT